MRTPRTGWGYGFLYPSLPSLPSCPRHPLRRLLESRVICTTGRLEWVWEHRPLPVPLQAPCQSSGQSLRSDLLGSRAAEPAQTQVTEQREVYHFQPRRCLFQQQMDRCWGDRSQLAVSSVGRCGGGCPHSSEASCHPPVSPEGGEGSLTGVASAVSLSGPVCLPS